MTVKIHCCQQHACCDTSASIFNQEKLEFKYDLSFVILG